MNIDAKILKTVQKSIPVVLKKQQQKSKYHDQVGFIPETKDSI